MSLEVLLEKRQSTELLSTLMLSAYKNSRLSHC